MQVKKPLIHEMAEQERPREKFELYGADKMSDAELLALILRTGSRSLSAVALAEEILNLNLPGSGLEKLYHLSKKDLMEIRGVGRVKAIEILALCELSVRLSKLTFREQLSFSSPASIARYYMAEFRSYRQEHLMMMLLDSKIIWSVNGSFPKERLMLQWQNRGTFLEKLFGLALSQSY